MIPLALVSLHEAADLFGVVGLTALGAFSWNRLRRRDQLRRAGLKERQAEYARRHDRWDRDAADALRCRGGVVR